MAGKHVGWGGKGGGDDDDYYHHHEKESVIMKSNKDHRVKLIIMRQPPLQLQHQDQGMTTKPVSLQCGK